jgi:ethanolamine utilization protein EutA (predicted chaperonin)
MATYTDTEYTSVVKLDAHGRTTVISNFGELSKEDCYRLARTLSHIRRPCQHIGYLYEYIVIVSQDSVSDSAVHLSQVVELALC